MFKITFAQFYSWNPAGEFAFFFFFREHLWWRRTEESLVSRLQLPISPDWLFVLCRRTHQHDREHGFGLGNRRADP